MPNGHGTSGSVEGASGRVSIGSGLRICYVIFRSHSLVFQSRYGARDSESYWRRSRMVAISMSGSGEGLGWATGRGYSTITQIWDVDLV